MSKQYEVTITKRNPAHDERGGIKYTFEAKDKAQAVRYGRRQATDDGHVGTGQGRYTVSAKEMEGAE